MGEGLDKGVGIAGNPLLSGTMEKREDSDRRLGGGLVREGRTGKAWAGRDGWMRKGRPRRLEA